MNLHVVIPSVLVVNSLDVLLGVSLVFVPITPVGLDPSPSRQLIFARWGLDQSLGEVSGASRSKLDGRLHVDVACGYRAAPR